MKIISLNAYFGHAFEALMAFIEREAADTDVFCFQEMLSDPSEDFGALPYRGRSNILQEIQRRLPGFTMEFFATQENFDIPSAPPGRVLLGNATFYSDTLPVTGSQGLFIYNGYNSYDGKDYETLGHAAVMVSFGGEQPLTVTNVHGNSQPAHKRDSEKRLEQSRRILEAVRGIPGDHVIIGDFNLYPDTQSVALFERAGYRNLVTEFGVSDTRGSLVRQLFPEYEHGPYGFQPYADHAFVSPGIRVTRFDVPDLPLSDHLPLILECEQNAPTPGVGADRV